MMRTDGLSIRVLAAGLLLTLACAPVAASNANDLTVAQFDGLENDLKSSVVSQVVRHLVGRTNERHGGDAARCMADLFKSTNGENVGLHAINLRMHVVRDNGLAETAKAINEIAFAYDTLFARSCADK